jgi:catechol 2,3-dioxygenase-like lactoylglutathione lyase family enzyme
VPDDPTGGLPPLLAATLGPASNVYHVGFVVPDLDAAIASVGEALRLTFTEPIEMPGVQLFTPAGPAEAALRLCYSSRPIHVELIQSVPGTLWDSDDALRGHHLGVWADDVEAEGARLEALGMPPVWWGVGGDGRRVFSYHSTGLGFYVELVDTVARAFYPGWFTSVDPALAELDT